MEEAALVLSGFGDRGSTMAAGVYQQDIVIPAHLSPGDVFYIADNSMILCHPRSTAAAAGQTVHHGRIAASGNKKISLSHHHQQQQQHHHHQLNLSQQQAGIPSHFY